MTGEVVATEVQDTRHGRMKKRRREEDEEEESGRRNKGEGGFRNMYSKIRSI